MVLGVRTGRSGVGVPPSGHGNQRHGAGLAGRATGARVRRGGETDNGVRQRQDEG